MSIRTSLYLQRESARVADGGQGNPGKTRFSPLLFFFFVVVVVVVVVVGGGGGGGGGAIDRRVEGRGEILFRLQVR